MRRQGSNRLKTIQRAEQCGRQIVKTSWKFPMIKKKHEALYICVDCHASYLPGGKSWKGDCAKKKRRTKAGISPNAGWWASYGGDNSARLFHLLGADKKEQIKLREAVKQWHARIEKRLAKRKRADKDVE